MANGGEPATGVGEDGQIETETGGERRGVGGGASEWRPCNTPVLILMLTL